MPDSQTRCVAFIHNGENRVDSILFSTLGIDEFVTQLFERYQTLDPGAYIEADRVYNGVILTVMSETRELLVSVLETDRDAIRTALECFAPNMEGVTL